MKNLIETLKTEHKKILSLLEKDYTDKKNINKLRTFLCKHINKENGLLYPEFEKMVESNEELLDLRRELDNFYIFGKDALNVLDTSNNKSELPNLFMKIKSRIKFEEEHIFVNMMDRS